MMKKIIICLAFLLGMVTSSWASSYSGDISGSTLISGASAWDTAVLSWTVDNESNPGYWTYDYEWSAINKGLSHLNIEVSTVFDLENDLYSYNSYLTGIKAVEGPQTFDEIGGSIFGIKWDLNDTAEDIMYFHLTLVSTKAPMWGDFYAKDGNGGTVNARNLNFGTDTTDPIGDGNNGGWVLVPDTVVPIPSAILLLGSGLIGLVGFRRKIRKG